MFAIQKSHWMDFIESYKNMTFLWDPKNQNYTNKVMRNEGSEKLYQIYKKIDDRGMLHMKKKIDTMRTTYNRERKKIRQYRRNGINYKPTLWYFKYLSFLDGTVGTQKKTSFRFSFNQDTNEIILENHPAVEIKREMLMIHSDDDDEDKQQIIETRSSSDEGEVTSTVRLKREILNIDSDSDDEDTQRNIEIRSSSDEEENTKNTRPSRPKRIHDLLQKQQAFVETANKLLTKKEEDWQVLGKAIGLQLYNLDPEQRFIANKLIYDVLYYGRQKKLSVESCLRVENVTESDDNQVLYAESTCPESSDYE